MRGVPCGYRQRGGFDARRSPPPPPPLRRPPPPHLRPAGVGVGVAARDACRVLEAVERRRQVTRLTLRVRPALSCCGSSLPSHLALRPMPPALALGSRGGPLPKQPLRQRQPPPPLLVVRGGASDGKVAEWVGRVELRRLHVGEVDGALVRKRLVRRDHRHAACTVQRSEGVPVGGLWLESRGASVESEAASLLTTVEGSLRPSDAVVRARDGPPRRPATLTMPRRRPRRSSAPVAARRATPPTARAVLAS